MIAYGPETTMKRVRLLQTSLARQSHLGPVRQHCLADSYPLRVKGPDRACRCARTSTILMDSAMVGPRDQQ